jgi:hypothetical protein
MSQRDNTQLLECLLAALVLKYGDGEQLSKLILFPEEVEATLGHGFEFTTSNDGSVELRVLSPETLAERDLPEITHPQPLMTQ